MPDEPEADDRHSLTPRVAGSAKARMRRRESGRRQFRRSATTSVPTRRCWRSGRSRSRRRASCSSKVRGHERRPGLGGGRDRRQHRRRPGAAPATTCCARGSGCGPRSARHQPVRARDHRADPSPTHGARQGPVHAARPNRSRARSRRCCCASRRRTPRRRRERWHVTRAEDGVVVSAQNGLNERVIAGKIVGEARTIGCFVNFGADYHRPGPWCCMAAAARWWWASCDGRRSTRIEAIPRRLKHLQTTTRS